jgi:UDP-2,3-diacylglucosamine hydrolase
MIYFASDFHLGIPSWKSISAKEREKRILRWLDMVSKDSALSAIYLVGDIFDFWFDYATVVPKGYVRFLGKLAELSDRGVELHLFTGNHDVWFFDYFENELNAKIHRNPIQITLGQKHFFIGHGDGLGPGDFGYKFIKKIFRNPFCQWLFRWLHPDIGAGLAMFFSKSSRSAQKEQKPFLGEDKEWLIIYANEKLQQNPEIDYFIFGHRHLAQDLLLKNDKSRYVNLGDWFKGGHYAVFDGETLHLKRFEL